MKKCFCDFRKQLLGIAGFDCDRTDGQWAREINKVDFLVPGLNSLVGQIIPAGDVEVEIFPRLYLVASPFDDVVSAEDDDINIEVVAMDEIGRLYNAQIPATGNNSYAVKNLREDVATMLANFKLRDSNSELDDLAWLMARFPDCSETEVVQKALSHFRLSFLED